MFVMVENIGCIVIVTDSVTETITQFDVTLWDTACETTTLDPVYDKQHWTKVKQSPRL